MRKTMMTAGALVAGVALAWGAASAAGGAPEYPASIPACVSEDGSGGALPCVWDARARGNGEGRSLILWADGSQTYLG